MKKILFVVIFVSLSYPAHSQKQFHLASGGKANYDIVVSPSASSAELFAAEELATYLSIMGKTAFNVQTSSGVASIFVGAAVSKTDSLCFSNFEIKEPEQYGIYTLGKNIVLTGGDSRGVTYSVYAFLQQLGCRWIAPDYVFFEGSSRHIPSFSDLVYCHQGDFVDKPEMKYRKFYVEEGKSHNVENLLQLIDWMPKLRYNTLVIPIDYQGSNRVKWDNWREKLTPELQKRGIIIEVGGHGYENFLNARMENGKLFELHPEWFGMDENGKRSSDRHSVFCTSNRDAVGYLRNNVIEYLRFHPEIEIFDFWPPDMDKWCCCAECSKSTSEQRHFDLVNYMAKTLREDLPKVKLECLAYSQYISPPENVKLDSAVLLDFCPVTQNYQLQFNDHRSVKNKMYDESLGKWLETFNGDISIYSYYRKYKWRSLPNIFPHYLQNELKYFRSTGIKGISIYSEPGDWFTYGLNYYVLGHLAQHADTDMVKLISEYTGLLFGQSAEVMTEMYEALEEIVRNGCYFADSEPQPPEQYDKYLERVGRLAVQVRNARTKYGKTDSVLNSHLHRVELMLEYVSASIRQQQELILDNKRGDYRLTEELKEFFRANIDKGVFVI